MQFYVAAKKCKQDEISEKEQKDQYKNKKYKKKATYKYN